MQPAQCEHTAEHRSLELDQARRAQARRLRRVWPQGSRWDAIPPGRSCLLRYPRSAPAQASSRHADIAIENLSQIKSVACKRRYVDVDPHRRPTMPTDSILVAIGICTV